ncbi:MAG: hypothetical protein IPK07_00205 [Deltaproteobacteria bacterium]|nr:hypothetical protein [Deltaproteobacteria bacterium]
MNDFSKTIRLTAVGAASVALIALGAGCPRHVASDTGSTVDHAVTGAANAAGTAIDTAGQAAKDVGHTAGHAASDVGDGVQRAVP